MTLSELIKEYGQPHALLDHWDKNSISYAIWGFEETMIIDSNEKCSINGDHSSLSPLDLFQETINKWKKNSASLAAIGFISYDFKKIIYPHINFQPIKNTTPLLWFGKPKNIIPFQNNEFQKKLNTKRMTLLNDIPALNNYEKYINKIKSFLKNGDSYQINFTQPKKYQIHDDPFDIYMSFRNAIKPFCGVYLDPGPIQILSFSPERFFRTCQNHIESFPMKGTRPRSTNLFEDEKLAHELFNSSKDRAEHLMIVDLIRNDLGKVCKYGSVNVENLYKIKSFETVHQMETRVFGSLKSKIQEKDIIQSLFPGGSITGAPKEKSMQIIDSLENYSRGIYTGSIGSVFSNGDMDFNIAIRTMTINNNAATYPVGGGIVWDSTPIEEWNEAHQKSKIIDQFQKNNKYELEPNSNN